jgi:signal transduction histidine kinase
LHALDGRPIHSVFAAARMVASRQPGERIECVVRRGEHELKCQITLEETTGEPTFSFAGKTAETPPEGTSNPPPRSVAEPPRAVEERSSPGPANGKVGGVDSFADLRERLRQREALIERLEAELAELRRERDRIAGTLAPNTPSTEPAPTTPAPAPRPIPIAPKK